MPTTSNFGWTTPADTDLVKDGAAAIRTLGNGVDSSMAQLKGGTTGQVLSKTSNTDMAFTWVTQDDANAIQNAIIDAKGDIITGTANDTPAILSVGSNGSTLVADSAATTGLRWQANNAPKNGVINGGMEFWQRGTSFAFTNPQSTYTADRWLGRHQATNVTYSQQTSGLTGFLYSMRVQRPNSVTGTNQEAIYYQFETPDSYRYAGQTVTLSFWAKAGANFSANSSLLDFGIYSGTGTNQNITSGAYTGQVTVNQTSVTLTTSWQRFSITGTVGSTASQIALIIAYTPTGTAGANDWFEFTGVQFELGSVATTWSRSGGTLAGELAACQRYLPTWTNTGSGSAAIAVGQCYNTTQAVVVLTNPVPSRVPPTGITIIGSGTNYIYKSDASLATLSSTVFNAATNAATQIVPTGSGLTAGNATNYLLGAGNTIYATGCEL